jgi:hypothetical protein
MMKMRPASKRAIESSSSAGQHVSRIHSTSIGAPRYSTSQAGALADRRVPAVAADDQRRVDFNRARRCIRRHSGNNAITPDEAGCCAFIIRWKPG